MNLKFYKIWHIQRTDIYECVQFGEDPNKNQDVMN